MKRKIVYSAAVTLSLVLYGCGKPAGSEPATQTSSSTASEGSNEKEHGEHSHSHAEGGHDHDHGDHDDEGGLSDMDKMKAALAKLSPEDAASAEKQHFCPVTGDMLGAMGAPLKIDVNGQQVWVCCEGCRDPLLENPEEYLAKLNKE